jgi:hypothetical protein
VGGFSTPKVKKLSKGGWIANRRGKMCLSCGCGENDDNHGDARHITTEMLEAAAEAAEITVEEAANNIVQALQPAQSE